MTRLNYFDLVQNPGMVLARRVWLFVSIGYCAALPFLLVWLGPSVIVMAAWDQFLLLNGGWRILLGQVPHTDFYNPIGPLTYAFVSLGMTLTGPGLSSLSVGNTVFLVLAMTWAAVVAFRRLDASYAALFVAFVATLIAATRSLGWEPQANSYAMIYNRHGWVLLSILYLQLFCPSGTELCRSPAEHISVGCLLGLIFLCKVNFFIIAAGAIVAATILRFAPFRSLWFVALGFFAVLIAVWLEIGVNPVDYLGDLKIAALAQESARRVDLVRKSVEENALNLAGVLVTWSLLFAFPLPSGRHGRLTLSRISIVAAYMVGTAYLISSANAEERSDVPMFGVVGLLLIGSEQRMRESSGIAHSARPTWRYAASSVLVAGLVMHIAVKDLASIVNSITWRSYRVSGIPPSQRFHSELLGDFAIPATTDWKTVFWYSRDLPARVNEGLGLLRKNVGSSGSLMVLGFADPFSYALGWPFPKGVPLWWDFGLSYNMRSYPHPDVVFRNVSHVMVPVLRESDPGCCKSIVSSLIEIYGEYVSVRYVELDKSAHWVLLRRRE